MTKFWTGFVKESASFKGVGEGVSKIINQAAKSKKAVSEATGAAVKAVGKGAKNVAMAIPNAADKAVKDVRLGYRKGQMKDLGMTPSQYMKHIGKGPAAPTQSMTSGAKGTQPLQHSPSPAKMEEAASAAKENVVEGKYKERFKKLHGEHTQLQKKVQKTEAAGPKGGGFGMGHALAGGAGIAGGAAVMSGGHSQPHQQGYEATSQSQYAGMR